MCTEQDGASADIYTLNRMELALIFVYRTTQSVCSYFHKLFSSLGSGIDADGFLHHTYCTVSVKYDMHWAQTLL